MRNFSARRRCGWSLLELVVVMPLMAMLLSGSAILLTVVFRTQGILSSDLQQRSSYARLAVQFRNDAHEATNVKSVASQSCDLLLEGEAFVHYEIKNTTLHRELRRGESVLERESFPLAGLQGAFSLDKSLELPLIRLRLEATAEPRKYAGVARSSMLEAAIGSRHERRIPEGVKP